MSKSMRLRVRDVEAAAQLCGECGELWADPAAWRAHLLAGASRLTGQAVGVYLEFDLPAPGGPLRVRAAADGGWRDGAARDHYLRFSGLHPNPFNDQAGFDRVLIALTRRGRVSACREQLCPDAEWYRGEFYNDYRRPAFNDGYAATFRRHGSAACTLLHLSQDSGENRPPTQWTRRIIAVLHRQFAGLYETRLATQRHRSLTGLSPRLRQTLACLLEGDGEKQVARCLGIRPSTAHEYVTALYRHFGVASRPELMAYFVRRRPAPAAP